MKTYETSIDITDSLGRDERLAEASRQLRISNVKIGSAEINVVDGRSILKLSGSKE